MKTSTYPPKEICWGPTIYCSKQTKLINKTKTTDAPRKHIMHEAIKIYCFER
jgi:hypothetical protein